MNRVVITVTLSALLLLSGAGQAWADEFYQTQLILRYFADGSANERARLRDAHRDYVAKNGREMASFRLLDEDATVIGEGAWVAFESAAQADAFLDGDPYQQAGLYREVSIDKADLYMLDKWFSIAPAWRSGPSLERAHEQYDEQVRRIQREE